MNTYKAYYKHKEIEVEAETSYKAQLKASEIMKAKKSYEVTVVLVAVEGEQVTYNGTEF